MSITRCTYVTCPSQGVVSRSTNGRGLLQNGTIRRPCVTSASSSCNANENLTFFFAGFFNVDNFLLSVVVS